MGRKSTNTTNCESVTSRYIECLQVGKEQVVIEVRPSFWAIGDEPENNKWMEHRHWNELYGILLESANAHINSSGNCRDPQKAQGSLLKVLYQFEENASRYKNLLTTYEYHSKYPLLPLTTSDGFLGVEPYCHVLVATVYPCDADIVGFDDVPSYWHIKSQTTKGHSCSQQNTTLPATNHSEVKKEHIESGCEASTPQEEGGTQELVLPKAEVTSKVQDNGIKSDDKSPTPSIFQEPLFDPVTMEIDNSDGASGASSLSTKEELEAPVVKERCLSHLLEVTSPDMFDSFDGVENDQTHSRVSGKCKNKCKKILVSSQSSAEEGNFEIADDVTSHPFRNVTQRKNSSSGVNTRSNAHESKLKLKHTEQTKSIYFDSKHDDEDGRVLAIKDTSPESLMNELTLVCNAENSSPVRPVVTSSESDSDEDMARLKKSYKRQRSFSKFECERKTDNLDHEIVCSDQNLPESMQSADFGSDVEPKAIDISPPARRCKRKIFGNLRTVEKEVIPSLEEPSSLATANSAQNLERESSVKSPRKKAGGSKLGNKRSAIQSVQKKVQRQSPRKVGVVCYAEQDDSLLEPEPCEVVKKRVSPRKKAKRENKVEEGEHEWKNKLTESQAKLLALYGNSGQKGNVGDNQGAATKQASPKKMKITNRGKNRKGPGAQKRVTKSTDTEEKKELKDASSNQITNYFEASTKKNVSSGGASTSGSNTKSQLLEVEGKESLSKGMLNSDDSNDSSVSNGSASLPNKIQGQSQERDEEKALYARIIGNLDLENITKSFNKCKGDLHGIFKGRIPCERHALYKTGEQSLRYSTSTNPFSDQQLSHMMNLLTDAFCRDNPLHFVDYMWKVLVPELANHVFMDEFDLDYAESLEKIHELYILSNQDSD